MKIGILGAGYSGLYAVNHFRGNPDFEITVLEQQKDVGGTWCYTQSVGTDQNGLPIHSSMYDNLRIHIPKQLMQLPELKFEQSKDLPTYVGHREIKKYLEEYADFLDLKKFIKFGMAAKEIKRLEGSNGETQWLVTCLNVKSEPAETELYIFDKVILCTGHHALALKPDVPGVDSFPGQIMHSHDYRNNSTFGDKTVVVAGAGLSGVDIAQEIGDVARKVILVNPRRIQLANCKTSKPIVEEQGYVDKIEGEMVHLTNGNVYRADVIMFCTGYRVSDYLFHENCEITYDQRRLMPFYKFLVHAKYPSLAVVGLVSKIVPTITPPAQIQFLKKLWEGSIQLPSEEDMIADAEAEYQRRLDKGFSNHYAHFLFRDLQFRYIEELMEIAHLEPLPPVIEKLLCFALDFALENPEHYRETGVKVLDDFNYELYPESQKILDQFWK